MNRQNWGRRVHSLTAFKGFGFAVAALAAGYGVFEIAMGHDRRGIYQIFTAVILVVLVASARRSWNSQIGRQANFAAVHLRKEDKALSLFSFSLLIVAAILAMSAFVTLFLAWIGWLPLLVLAAVSAAFGIWGLSRTHPEERFEQSGLALQPPPSVSMAGFLVLMALGSIWCAALSAEWFRHGSQTIVLAYMAGAAGVLLAFMTVLTAAIFVLILVSRRRLSSKPL